MEVGIQPPPLAISLDKGSNGCPTLEWGTLEQT
jgi:hypothetical protein